MQERLKNVLKWVLIAFGVLFLIQVLIIIGVVMGVKGFSEGDFSFKSSHLKNLKEVKPIIDYVEEYKIKNNIYPTNVQGVKIKPDVYFDYETSKNGECYTIKTKSKKDDVLKTYQHCSSINDNSNSNTESYVEYRE